MKSAITTVFATITLSLALLACNKESSTKEIAENQENCTEQVFGEVIVLGEKLNNPYALSNMQATLDHLRGTKAFDSSDYEQLEPNWLYVRFLPKDSTDVAILQNLDLELFDYPLDYDIMVEGYCYHDPTIPENQITWQYTCVRPDFPFPDITHEILEQCFIPEDDESLTKGIKDDLLYELELAAIQRAGLPQKYQPVRQTKAFGLGTKPSGTIRVHNDITGIDESLRGVKVRCHYLVNISSGYTDENGHYSINNKYVCNPHYAIVYENTKDFTIWGNYAFVAAANHNLGYQDNSGYDKIVDTSEDGWNWAVINNAAYDYYEMCTTEGILTPPANLKIWCWPNASSSSAPMLRHLLGINSSGFATMLVSFLIKGTITPAAAIISAAEFLINSALPDVTIGMASGGASSNYKKHYYTVWHELTHASHFAKVGETLWGPYINYIVMNGGYGDGSSTSIGRNVCELGESWAYANQYYSSKQTWSSSIWFSSSVTSIKQLLDAGTLTRKQIYDCLTKDVRTINDLKSKLIEKYPTKASQINAAF